MKGGDSFNVPAYQALTIGEGTGTLTMTGTTQEIPLTYPTDTEASDYVALVAQITPQGADGTYTDISTRATDAAGWSVVGDLENNKVTVTTSGGGNALLRVTLIGTDGSELTASCIVTLLYNEDTQTYYVYTIAGLEEWADAASSNDNDTNCTLMADIDYEDGTWSMVWGTYSGTFDGQNHTISNMQLLPNSSAFYGFFEEVGTDGVVRNVTFKGITNTEWGLSAGVIAWKNYGTIFNCRVEDCTFADFRSRSSGIVAENSGTISCCAVMDSNLSGSNGAGGIAGSNSGEILACWADVQVSPSEASDAGGVCGYNSTDDTITACYWAGNAAAGIGKNNTSNPDPTIKIEESNWQTACKGMNAAIEDLELGYHWAIKEGDTRPSLVENGSRQ